MASIKGTIAENVQRNLEKMDWHAAIVEMERLFLIDSDPHIRVRIGDLRRKLNKMREAIQDYLHAADLFAERGFIGKALAQYNLALRLDASNDSARTKRDKLRSCSTLMSLKREPVEYEAPQSVMASAQQ